MGMKLVTVPGNGFCFISCVLVTLAEQGINKTIDVLSVEIMIENNNHITHYKQYGNQEDMTTFQAKCADYFQKEFMTVMQSTYALEQLRMHWV